MLSSPSGSGEASSSVSEASRSDQVASVQQIALFSSPSGSGAAVFSSPIGSGAAGTSVFEASRSAEVALEQQIAVFSSPSGAGAASSNVFDASRSAQVTPMIAVFCKALQARNSRKAPKRSCRVPNPL